MSERLTFPIALGDEVRDTITGFTGIVVCLSEWFNRCQRAQVQAPVRPDRPDSVSSAESFDVDQLVVTAPAKVARKNAAAEGTASVSSGGPMPDTARPRQTREF